MRVHRIEEDGRDREQVEHRLEPALQVLLILHVRAREKPAANVSKPVAHGADASDMQAVLAVKSAKQSQSQFDGLARNKRHVPGGFKLRALVGMNAGKPAGAASLFHGQPGVLEPSAVEVLGRTIGLRKEDQRRACFGQDAVMLLHLKYARLCLPALRDVVEHAHGAFGSAGARWQRAARDAQHPANGIVGIPKDHLLVLGEFAIVQGAEERQFCVGRLGHPVHAVQPIALAHPRELRVLDCVSERLQRRRIGNDDPNSLLGDNDALAHVVEERPDEPENVFGFALEECRCGDLLLFSVTRIATRLNLPATPRRTVRIRYLGFQ
jgi:hypothetical protein